MFIETLHKIFDFKNANSIKRNKRLFVGLKSKGNNKNRSNSSLNYKVN